VNADSPGAQALKLTPEGHADVLLLQSQRAAAFLLLRQYPDCVAAASAVLAVAPTHALALARRARAYDATAQYEKATKDLDVLVASGGDAGEDVSALHTRVRALSKAEPESRPPAGLPALPPRPAAREASAPPAQPRPAQQQWLKCVLGGDTRLLSYSIEGGLGALRAAVARKWPEEGPLVLRAMAPPGASAPPAEPPGGISHGEALSGALLPWLQVGRIAKLRLVRPGEEGEPAAESGLLDEWILDFASLVREHLGVDAEAHLEAHSAGLAACSAACALAEARPEEAQPLFEQAALRFQDAAALALYNWGNVAMCVARKRLAPPRAEAEAGAPPVPPPPPPPPAPALVEEVEKLLSEAEARFAVALRVKPELNDAHIAFAEHRYERARLLAPLPGREAEADALFVEACSRFAATFELLPEEAAPPPPPAEGVEPQEPEPSLRSQVLVMWGNVLYEHSQARVRQAREGWQALLDEAVRKFGAAGCAQVDVDAALAVHASRAAPPPSSS